MLISIALSALCSMLEATLLSTPLSFITGLEEQGVKGAARLKKLKQNTDRPISAILCLNTIANTVGASIVGSLVYEVYGDALVGAFSTVFTLMILFFSEIIPKTIGTSYWRSLALPASSIISGMIFITYPLVWILEKFTKLISSRSEQVSVSREDISAMVSVATEEEEIEKEEKKMIQNILKLDEVTAHEIMTPSVVVEMVPGNMTIREFYESENTHSRILIYDEENDEYVTGYVLRQEVLEKMAEDKFDVTLDDIIRPIMTFREEDSVSDIWETLLEKKELLFSMGVDKVEVLDFTRDFSTMTTKEYLLMLIEKYGAKTILIGYDNRMGCDAKCADEVAAVAEGLGLEVVRSVMIPSAGGIAVSSTKIRQRIEEGDMDAAASMLGYDYSLHGVVVAGNRLGSTIGFPTANMQLYEQLKLIPGNGVYFVKVQTLGRCFHGMCNVGFRPTVGSGGSRTMETHIFDFEEDIYGLDIEVTFLRKIRDEIRFDSLEELALQLEKDRGSCMDLI